MVDSFIMQMRPLFGKEEKKAICEYMDEDGFITEYKRTEKFEEEIANFTGAKHCIVVNNGTISLTLAALALGVGIGDEVIVPNYTMVATPNSIKLIGAQPVFVDVEAETLCLDISLVEASITKKTKAIILVSANGRYPSYEANELLKLCEKHGVYLIEDAAQSLGSVYPDKAHIGTKGIIGSFSFSAPKIISTGQGGALVTNDNKIADKLRRLKDFGRSSGGNDIHDTIGYNFKFTELQAVIGLEQMKKLDFRIKRKKEIWQRYYSELEGLEEIKLFKHNLMNTAPWFIDCLVQKRTKLQQFLKENNVGTRIMYPPLNHQKAYSIEGNHPVSEMIGEKGLWLPSSVQLTNEEISYITSKIKSFYNSTQN